MKCGVLIDVCVFVALIFSTHYVWNVRRSTNYRLIDRSPQEIENDDELGAEVEISSEGDENALGHPSRDCNPDGTKLNVIILELTYAGLPSLDIEEIEVLGDRLLDILYEVS